MARYLLRIVRGPESGREVALNGPVEIGRSPDADVPLVEDSLVSSRHARLTPGRDGVLVEDLGSRNGTFVNGVRIDAPTLLRPGDTLTLGDTSAELDTEQEPEAEPAGGFVLQIVSGAAGGRRFDLASPIEVGREAVGIPLPDDQLASRRHARLTPTTGGVTVEDLGSRNGTFVNGVRIAGPVLVRPGERVLVGSTAIEVQAVVPAAPARFALVVVGGPDAGARAEVNEPLTIGRDRTAGLALVDDILVSRLHARLTPGPHGALLEDLGSRNGTFVNEALVRGATTVRPGDRIVVGGSAIELRVPGPVAPETAVQEIARPAPTVFQTVVQVPVMLTSEFLGWPKPEGEAGEAPAVSGRREHRTLTFLVCALGVFMATLDNLVVLFALTDIQEDLQATTQDLEWVVNAYTLAFAVFLLPAATLGDRFGRVRVFAFGVGLFTVASAACALAPNIDVLLIARAAEGIGGAFITPLSLAILSSAFPAEKRGLVLGGWSGIAGLAIAIGPVVGGVIVTAVSWEWIFWLNVPIGVVVVPLCLLYARESFGAATRLDIPGLILSAVGLFGVVLGVVEASSVGWSSRDVIVPLVVGLGLVAVFIGWQLRAKAPMLDLGLFRSRAFSAANVSSFCMYVGLFGSIFLLSQFLQLVQGYSAVEAGLRSLPWTGMPIFVAPIAGVLAERLGGRALMAAGLALEAVSFVLLALVLEPGVAYGRLVGPFVVGGVGLGLFFAPLAHVILGSVRLEQEGQASGANNAIRQIGGVLGVAVMTTIFTSYGSAASGESFVDGLIPPMWVGAVVLAIGAVAALAIPPVRAEEQVLSMTSVVPAVGGFTPGVTVVSEVSTIQAGQPA